MTEDFTRVMAFAMTALYKNGAAKDVAKSLKSAPNRVDGLADTTYKFAEVVDERTDSIIKDEEIAFLASALLEEMVEIGNAAGLDYKPQEIAGALRQMIIRFVQEQGGDAQGLQQAMDQVDPSYFEELAK